VRIITGSARGRRLLCPEGLGTRPILDAQKQALFNVLGARVDVDGVMDIFAGSGELGLEALSRGARHAVFVEKGRAALTAPAQHRNVRLRRARARVVAARRLPHRLGTTSARVVDLVFIDAPFPMFTDDRERLAGNSYATTVREPRG
jgi:16S rRNA (guanine(966)-N(2))-methyltransferase RsmD